MKTSMKKTKVRMPWFDRIVLLFLVAAIGMIIYAVAFFPLGEFPLPK